ncbi:MAG: hypothetical protein GY839_04855 [candidate division Zixibacteria bacterium]|nr:hypothetical protein [candidate division Zixibacteria bacterium]
MMKSRYIALFLLLFALLIACSKEVDQFPNLSKRIPYLMERLYSNRWKVRYCSVDDLTGRDAETKRVIETLIRDENKGVANRALIRYLIGFVDIDKTLFKPELYFHGVVGYDLFEPGPVNDEDYDAFVDNHLRVLDSARLDIHSMDESLMIVGIMGKPSDAEAVYPFLQSPYDDIALAAAKAVIRLGHKKKGCETLQRLASWDSSKDTPYMYWALYALKEMQDPELETIVLDGLASIDSSEGIAPNKVNRFLLLAADVTSKDVWNVKEPWNKAEGVGQFPDLSKRIPYLMERLHSNRWKVRYCLISDLTGRDIETKRVLKTLMLDENKSVANQATVRYLNAFVEIDRSLFKPELYVPGRFPVTDLPDKERTNALVDYCLGRRDIPRKSHDDEQSFLPVLNPEQLDNPRMHETLTVVGILGKPGDAEKLYPFLQSTNDYAALGAIKAVIRIGDKKKGMEALRRLASWDPSKHLGYVTEALYALKEMQDPELETIVIDVLSVIDQSEGIQLNWLNRFLLLAADVTSKDVWNIEKP